MTGPAHAPIVTRTASRRLVGVAGILGMTLSGFFVLAAAGLESGPVIFVLAVLMAIAPVPLLAAGVLWLDRFEPEPPRALWFTFLWGATVACFVALILNSVGEVVVGSSLGAEAAEVYGGSISAPVVEEAAKGAAIWFLVRRRRTELDGVLDGIVYAGMVGLGFAMTENVLYYGRGAVEEGLVGAVVTFVLRGVMSPFAHPVFTAATGIGFGLAARSRRRSVRFLAPLLGLGAAMVLHSLWNTAASTDAFFGVYLLLMVPVFFAILGIAWLDRRREARVVRRHLPSYVEAGWLPAGAVEELSSLRRRRRARKAAKATGGRREKRRVAELQLVATELAFLRDKRSRGLVGEDWQARESAQLDRLAELLRPTAAQTAV
ncbi:PrsW family intramembrane metalloprotease [Paraconexibacter sp.]|uniref:PrsW family intramembrane metalloprotease n=1 Tax=Paraconexibacter sp. TaxID=2949640 RepID=UPI0035653DDE